MAKITPPLKFHGGKSYLAPEIVKRMVPHLHYVEPFAGGCAVLLERDPNDERLWLSKKGGENGVSELINDIDGSLMNFWRVLRSPTNFPKFQRMAQATEMGKKVYEEAAGRNVPLTLLEGPPDGDVRAAWAFFVHCRQSRAGGFKGFTTLTRSRTRRGINGNVSEWLGAVDGLLEVHSRMRPVVVECVDAFDLIPREDKKTTLFYLDPPYLLETRATPGSYRFEMGKTEKESREKHGQLLELLRSLKGKVMLSGYRSKLYDAQLKSWTRHQFEIANHASGAKTKRRETEVLWCNF